MNTESAAGKAPGPRSRISVRNQILFFQQMEMLLASGVLISDALASLKLRFPDRKTRGLLEAIHREVAESRSGLSRALARFPRSFPPGVVAVIVAGEEGGSVLLARRFGDLADRLTFEEAHRRQIRRACAYPAFVLSMASVLYGVLLAVVFPRLSDLLLSVGGRLPAVTLALIQFSRFFRKAAPFLIGAAGAAGIGVVLLRRSARLGPRIDRWALRLPVVGAIYRESSVALICKIYRSLYLANQPAPANLDLCTRLVENQALRLALGSARHLIVQKGASLSAALAASGLFPPLACLAIETGEKSGQIASALERVSSHFHQQSRLRIEAAIAVINPLLTLFVVAGVGAVLIAFFQATYQVAYVVR